MRKLILLVPVAAVAAVLAGCGGKHVDPVVQQLNQNADKANVGSAEVQLGNTALNGSPADLPRRTLNLVRALKQTSADGVPAAWVNSQIDAAEQAVVDCAQCYQMLEQARP